MDFTKVKSALEQRGYQVSTFGTKEDAAAYLNRQIDGVSVAFGGSMTLKELGLYETLPAHNEFFSHWEKREDMSADELRRRAMSTDVYLTSANGLAETGEIVNIDGTGNRVASTLFGHRKVYFVVGRNKLAPTYEEALWRARNVAAPKNALRFGVDTPCVAHGGDRCYDCKSPARICKGLVVLWEKMNGSEAEVVLIDEDLGFSRGKPR